MVLQSLEREWVILLFLYIIQVWTVTAQLSLPLVTS